MGYVAVRTIANGDCQGRRCGATGVPIMQVYSEARFHHDPDARDVSAWLCPACLVRLGDRVHPIDLGEPPDREPYLYRGKQVPAF